MMARAGKPPRKVVALTPEVDTWDVKSDVEAVRNLVAVVDRMIDESFFGREPLSKEDHGNLGALIEAIQLRLTAADEHLDALDRKDVQS